MTELYNRTKKPELLRLEIQACAVESLLALTLLYNAELGGIAWVLKY